MMIETGGEPLYAQINRDLKTKRLHATLPGGSQIESTDNYDIDAIDSKVIYQNLMANVGNIDDLDSLTDSSKLSTLKLNKENRTDNAKLQSVTTTSTNYKTINNNTKYSNSINQNQWV